MNCGGRDGTTLARDIAAGMTAQLKTRADVVVCPPFTNMEGVQFECEEADIKIGGQDCAAHDNGAYTGQISAAMLVDAMCEFVILGHSERRQYLAETDQLIAAKATKAHEAELVAIICVGETESERGAGIEKTIVSTQLKEALPNGCNAMNTVVAYEPVWAIGTGKTASVDDVKEMHAHIRKELVGRFKDGAQFAILYGGSVKAANAKEILATANVDGALVGGASLKVEEFLGIIKAA